jgi:hypothetical protein
VEEGNSRATSTPPLLTAHPCEGARRRSRRGRRESPARAGAPFELIARQLGHRDVAMVAKVYGRFKPDTEERDRWEQAAAARDEAKWSGLAAKRVAKEPPKLKNLDEQSPHLHGSAGLQMIAGAGLEPATPAL